MKKLCVLFLVASVVFVAFFSVSAQYYQVQPGDADMYSFDNPYLYERPSLVNYDEFFKWRNLNGTTRPKAISINDLPFLDIHLGLVEMVALWEQITRYGPVEDVLTLKMLRAIPPTAKDKSKVVRVFSEREAMLILLIFDLPNGTYDGKWPWLES